MATSPEIRALAQDERDSLKRTRNGADMALAGVGVLSLLVAPPLALVGLVPAVLRWRAAEEMAVQERLIEDPPRDDFDEATAPVLEPFYPPDAVEPWVEPIVKYIEASIALCAHEAAMVSSVEKALGAQDRNEGRYAKERAEEAGAFAISTAQKLSDVTAVLFSLLSRFEREAMIAEGDLRTELEGAEAPSYEIPTSPLQALPDNAAAWLFRVGVPATAFRSWDADGRMFLAGHPFLQLQGVAFENAQTKERLAEELRFEGGGVL